MNKRSVIISSVLALSLALSAGCTTLSSGQQGGTAPSPAASSQPSGGSGTKAEFTFKVAYGQPTSNPRHIAADKYAKWVNEKTNGRVKFDLYPAEVLGTDKQMTEAVSMGTMDMTITASGVTAAYEPKLAVFELPFLFQSNDQVGKLLDGPIGTEVAQDLPKKGMRLLAYWENGLRQITNNKRPIEKVEDLKGLKIRAPENKMTIQIFETLGSSPSPLAFPELYLALSQGVFDGQENPIANIHSGKLFEVQKYITMSNHKYECYPFLVSESVWKKVPEDLQKIIQEGAIMFAQEHRRLVMEMEEAQLKEFEAAGMQVSRPDMTPFREATKGIYTDPEWEKVLTKDLIDKVVKAAADSAK